MSLGGNNKEARPACLGGPRLARYFRVSRPSPPLFQEWGMEGGRTYLRTFLPSVPIYRPAGALSRLLPM